MTIQTDRLELIALAATDLAVYLEGKDLFEAKFGLKETGRAVIPGIRARVTKTILSAIGRSTGDEWLFLTFWIAIKRSTKEIVAELGFKGVPDRSGVVEIGYGTMPTARNNGYMTEAVSALAGWVSSRPEVKSINAETDKENLASIRVLEKNGFSFQFDRANMKWWQLTVTDHKEPRYNYGE